MKICDLDGLAIELCATVSSVTEPEKTLDVCASAQARIEATDIPRCEAVDSGAWYPGWPLCELTSDCAAYVDPCCPDPPLATCSTTTGGTTSSAP